MRFDVLTLFPRIFDGFLSESLLEKAIEKKLAEVVLHDFREWTTDKHRNVDDRPFGGGPGMVIRVDPVVECVEDVLPLHPDPATILLLTPQGKRLDQEMVERLAKLPRIVMICGRYEGFDRRTIDLLDPIELSIGDYVLNGGEVAAMVVIEAVMRLLEGALGHEESARQDSFSGEEGLLEYPQYTRPREYRGLAVPEILLSGDHEKIAAWRREQSLALTRARRPDLIEKLPQMKTSAENLPQNAAQRDNAAKPNET